MSSPSLAKLTSVSTQTLSLLLERQRAPFIPSQTDNRNAENQNPLHLAQIKRNMEQLRKGILEMEEKDGKTEAIRLLRSQYDRMRNMLPGVEGIETLEVPPPNNDSMDSLTSPSASSLAPLPPTPPSKKVNNDFTPYTDDPEAGYDDPSMILQTQRDMMDDQDRHLDQLSHSINRQHHLSLQINDELDVHTGLLEELDTELERTEGRLSGARRRLDRVAQGAKNNGSAVTIAALILLLLILIIVFKT
ncbi:syntaxin-like protein [Moniliophthora roreri]|uniref:Putative syntaxin-like protein n=1 Tax=Moniliophthora roreri TaxID=221103 RepID=A0A0W0G4G7_MONRR|nr:syntaxin-like protein [Moniliophthora roreri]